MICKACKNGTHNKPIVESIEGIMRIRYECLSGTWCDCQHRERKVNSVPMDHLRIYNYSGNLVWGEFGPNILSGKAP